jgi:hypothetical protein
MDLSIILNQPYSKKTTKNVVGEVIAHPEKMNELIELFQQKNQRTSIYAGWILSYIAEQNPTLIAKHLHIIIKKLDNKVNNPALIRNVFRTLQFVVIPKKHEGYLLTKGFEFLNNYNSPIAVKVFAMTVIYNLSKKHPEIQNELKLSLENQFEHASAGFKSRATKILNKLNKQIVCCSTFRGSSGVAEKCDN